jgi:hypothetical protein
MQHRHFDAPVSPLRQRLIDDMNMRRFSRETQRNYLRDIGRLATFLGRSPDTATADDLRRIQIEQQEDGVPCRRRTASCRHRASSSPKRSTGRTWHAGSFVWPIRASCPWCSATVAATVASSAPCFHQQG